MFSVLALEVHGEVPLRKRERGSLSAGDAYNGRLTDDSEVDPLPKESNLKDRFPHFKAK